MVIGLDELRNLKQPPAGKSLRMVVPARQQMTLLNLEITDPAQPIAIEYRYVWLPGDPAAQHIPEKPYRAPFAVAGRYPVSQAFPVGITHTTPDSYHAVDLAMPVGTDIYAARAGIVFHVATTNFRGGLDPDKDFSAANIVNILHEDGTFAVYAHLNWNSIRVRPGDRVERGQFIAESGNTGFTTGPHLHFAVLKNRGMGLESVPVEFLGPNNSALTIATGDELIAY